MNILKYSSLYLLSIVNKISNNNEMYLDIMNGDERKSRLSTVDEKSKVIDSIDDLKGTSFENQSSIRNRKEFIKFVILFTLVNLIGLSLGVYSIVVNFNKFILLYTFYLICVTLGIICLVCMYKWCYKAKGSTVRKVFNALCDCGRCEKLYDIDYDFIGIREVIEHLITFLGSIQMFAVLFVIIYIDNCIKVKSFIFDIILICSYMTLGIVASRWYKSVVNGLMWKWYNVK